MGVITLLAGHVAALCYGLSHAALSAVVVTGVTALIVIKHLGYAAPRTPYSAGDQAHKKGYSPCRT